LEVEVVLEKAVAHRSQGRWALEATGDDLPYPAYTQARHLDQAEDDRLRGGAGQHAELVFVFPLGRGVVLPECLDQVLRGGQDLAGGAHGAAFLAARADSSS
jgi:hypothetical protein